MAVDFTFEVLPLSLNRQALAAGLYEAGRSVAAFFQGRDLIKQSEPFGRTPGPVALPVQWTPVPGLAYRNAYFASNGFGQGIPYQRTGRLQASWEQEAVQLTNGVELVTRNTASYAERVLGAFASAEPQWPMFGNTGWTPIAPHAERYAQRLVDSVIEEAQREWQTTLVFARR